MTNIYDEAGKRLTKEALEKIRTWMQDYRAVHFCCAKPQLVPYTSLQALLDITQPETGSALVDVAGGGAPLVVIGCLHCGQTFTYLATKIFPEWVDKNSTPRSSC